MAEPEKVTAYIPIADEVLTGSADLGDMLRRALAGEPLPPRPPAPTTPPAGHLRLLAAADGPMCAVVELHAPKWDLGIHRCQGCDFDGYEGEPPIWPCRTVELIAEQLDVDLREGT